MAGDTYTQPPYIGRGGWSWYTGSASWMHRAAIESICGLHVRGDHVCLSPRLPSHWQRVTLTLRQQGSEHVFIVCASWAERDIQQALAQGAQALAEGQWHQLGGAAAGDSSHLVISSGTAQMPPM
jgi:cyclic beta-1,2-glucan synthetase